MAFMSSSSERSANCSEHSARSASVLRLGTRNRNGDLEPLRVRLPSVRADGVGDDGAERERNVRLA
jgi:hypothetical protein